MQRAAGERTLVAAAPPVVGAAASGGRIVAGAATLSPLLRHVDSTGPLADCAPSLRCLRWSRSRTRPVIRGAHGFALPCGGLVPLELAAAAPLEERWRTASSWWAHGGAAARRCSWTETPAAGAVQCIAAGRALVAAAPPVVGTGSIVVDASSLAPPLLSPLQSERGSCSRRCAVHRC